MIDESFNKYDWADEHTNQIFDKGWEGVSNLLFSLGLEYDKDRYETVEEFEKVEAIKRLQRDLKKDLKEIYKETAKVFKKTGSQDE